MPTALSMDTVEICGVSALRICALCLYYIAGQRFLCPDIEDGFSLARL